MATTILNIPSLAYEYTRIVLLNMNVSNKYLLYSWLPFKNVLKYLQLGSFHTLHRLILSVVVFTSYLCTRQVLDAKGSARVDNTNRGFNYIKAFL